MNNKKYKEYIDKAKFKHRLSKIYTNIQQIFYFVYTFFKICDKILLCFNKGECKNEI